jgi:hypothetical protein
MPVEGWDPVPGPKIRNRRAPKYLGAADCSSDESFR